MPLAGTQIDLDIVILSEANQTEKEKYHMISLKCGILKKLIQMNLQNRKRLTNLENEFTDAGSRGGECMEERDS